MGIPGDYVLIISIHPPPARWDEIGRKVIVPELKFQSTHLLRGGTGQSDAIDRAMIFQSTHLLRGGTWWASVT